MIRIIQAILQKTLVNRYRDGLYCEKWPFTPFLNTFAGIFFAKNFKSSHRMIAEKSKLITWLLLLMVMTSGCVSTKKFSEEERRRKSCEEEAAALKAQNQELQTENTELTARLDKLRGDLTRLSSDTSRLGQKIRDLKGDYASLQQSYQDLLDNTEKLSRGSKAEIQRIMSELQLAQEKVIWKQDSLRALELELAAKQKSLIELQRILARKDSAVQALRAKVTKALLGFEGKGLSIEIRNGKVYVSLEESLLFKSGSWEVNERGASALRQLAEVLEANPDINVLIEGHTDNVPYRGAGQVKDNWDLSVMRATAIVKILTRNPRVNPARLTAAGRSEYLPVATNVTAEGKAKNRRTEIILTPRLDELFKIIESN